MESPPKISIRRGGRELVAELQPLWESLHRHHVDVSAELDRLGPRRSGPESWAVRRGLYEEWLAEPDAFVLLADIGTESVGYALVHIRAPEESWATGRVAELETLVVVEGHRDRGVGRALMDAVFAELRRLGVGHLAVASLAPNAGAHDFYRRLGLLDFTVGFLGPVPEAGDGEGPSAA